MFDKEASDKHDIDWLDDEEAYYRTEDTEECQPNWFDFHDMAQTMVEMTWIMSPVIVALVAFNFWRMIQEEYKRK